MSWSLPRCQSSHVDRSSLDQSRGMNPSLKCGVAGLALMAVCLAAQGMSDPPAPLSWLWVVGFLVARLVLPLVTIGLASAELIGRGPRRAQSIVAGALGAIMLLASLVSSWLSNQIASH